jgi:hypothetical protein
MSNKMNLFLNNFKQKSPKERFLFVLGLLLVIMYIILGSFFLFYYEVPLKLTNNQRSAFGILLYVYAAYRFYRIYKNENEV